MKDTIYHAFVGNDAPPQQTGVTRGIVMGGIVALVNTVLLFLPIDDGQKVQAMATLNPFLLLLSYIAYGVLDQWLAKTGRK